MAACLCAIVTSTPVTAQTFTTIINVPPDTAPSSIGPDTQLNVFEGGQLGDSFRTSNSSGTDSIVEVNILGGSVGDEFSAYSGSTVNIYNGSVDDNFSVYNSKVNIYGGTIGQHLEAKAGSTINVFGGDIGPFFIMRGGNSINFYGGRIHDVMLAYAGSAVNIHGGEFYLDGEPVPGLDQIGSSVKIHLPQDSQFTFTLTDGNIQTFAGDMGIRGDWFASDTITLIREPLPEIQSTVINVPSDIAPRGLRIGQTMNLAKGGELDANFSVSEATLYIEGGSVKYGLVSHGESYVKMHSGSIGNYFQAYAGSTVEIWGGTIGAFFTAYESSRVVIHGGIIGNEFKVYPDSSVSIYGGQIGETFHAYTGSTVNLVGRSFILDGVNITPQLEPGITVAIIDRNVSLEGILADGSLFSFDLYPKGINKRDFFDLNATLTITLIPEPGTIGLVGVGALGVMRRRRRAS